MSFPLIDSHQLPYRMVFRDVPNMVRVLDKVQHFTCLHMTNNYSFLLCDKYAVNYIALDTSHTNNIPWCCQPYHCATPSPDRTDATVKMDIFFFFKALHSPLETYTLCILEKCLGTWAVFQAPLSAVNQAKHVRCMNTFMVCLFFFYSCCAGLSLHITPMASPTSSKEVTLPELLHASKGA